MDLTILGSGSPPPQSSRAGQSLVVSTDDEHLLFDCGPMAVERLLENELPLKDITDLFLSHHHLDHNSSFFHFVITSWMYGRRELSVYGPEGVQALGAALEDIYEADIEYRKDFGRPVEGITGINYRRIDSDTTVARDGWTVSTHRVSHSIPTYAYRIDDHTSGESIVYSADTAKIHSLGKFAAGADILVHDAAVGPTRELDQSDPICDRESWRQFTANNLDFEDTPMTDVHSSGAEAGDIAAAADVEKLVLTHFLPAQDTAASREQAAARFDGEVIVAEDGLTIST